MSAKMGIKKLLSLGVLGVAMTLSSQVSAGTIKGSAHDFSVANPNGKQWDTQICLACHTPHNANGAGAQLAPLWGHTTTNAAAFTPYTGIAGSGVNGVGTSLNAITGPPTGTSLLCLSCHDGTVAVDSFGGNPGTIMINTLRLSADLGTDLSNDHPISFTYNTKLSTDDGSLWDPTDPAHVITTLPPGVAAGGVPRTGTIAQVLLENNKVECSSCHDVHNTFTGTTPNMLLKISIAKSELCLACHNK